MYIKYKQIIIYTKKGGILLNKITMVSADIAEKFRLFMEKGRIMLFEAPCGFGKTTLAKELLKNETAKILEVRADEADFGQLSENDDWDILLLEDLHLLQNMEEHQSLCILIRNNPQKRFVITSRGAISGELIPFRIAGLLIEVDEEDMFFDKQLTAEYFSLCGVQLSETELNSVMNITFGYPLALEMFAEKMRMGSKYNQKLAKEIKYGLYKYYDEMIFCRFDLNIRRFLLELAPFEKFNAELAKMVSGDSEAGKILAKLQKVSRMLRNDENDLFYFWPIFRDFLMWEQDVYYTEEQKRALFSRGGLYYELQAEYVKALEFYSKSRESNKVSELIIKITSLHPGMGYYEELENYYISLPDEMVAESPALMQGKSMLCSLRADYEGSERWYNELKEFACARKNLDAAAKEAKSRLAWLDISLPQRGVTGLVDTIGKVFRLAASKEVRLMPFSVTSSLPSIMNGGKDFSYWSKKDDLLYATMRIPVEGILGKDGIGLADCAIAESKFEKGENISDKMLLLVSKLNEIQSKGTPDIEFAVVGLLVRNQMDAGKAEEAGRLLEALRERFIESGNNRFIPNIDAMMCRIALRCSNSDYVDEWYRDKAPKDSLNIKVMKRYQYFTEAMTELSFGDSDAALLTLSPLEPYCEKCERHIDTIHLRIITAIARFRKNDAAWKKEISAAVKIAEEYGFERTISVYGAAVLPLLEKAYGENTSKFVKRAVKAARAQAVYYPDFLRPQSSLFEKLTEAELQVLRLLCADKSNSEIGEILNIRLATVKSHVSHILQKLDVSRRSEAKTTAQRLHII